MNLCEIVREALLEDLPSGDLTTDSLEFTQTISRARLLSKQQLILSGCEPFNETFNQIDKNIKIFWNFSDGAKINPGETICTLEGKFSGLLKGERTALNFLGHLSGIATKASLFVEKTKNTSCKILDTRKTTPGLRDLEKQAVVHGGATNHRMSLSDAILIKENHIRAAGNITKAVNSIRSKALHLPIEIEVTTIAEVDEALKLKVERLLLDNMSNEMMDRIIKKVDRMCILEASGNMTLDRIESVAKLGVDFISVGAITHSAPSADVSLLFNTEK
jgi:nicotinate-nucleotide pyrophosphorylase (carboxylating)